MKVTIVIVALLLIGILAWPRIRNTSVLTIPVVDRPESSPVLSELGGDSGVSQRTGIALETGSTYQASIELLLDRGAFSTKPDLVLPTIGMLERASNAGSLGSVIEFRSGVWKGALEGDGETLVLSLLGEQAIYETDAPIVLSKEHPHARARVRPVNQKLLFVRDGLTEVLLNDYEVSQFRPSTAMPELEFNRVSLGAEGFLEPILVTDHSVELDSEGRALFLVISKPGYLEKRVVLPGQVQRASVGLFESCSLLVYPNASERANATVGALAVLDRRGATLQRQLIPASGPLLFNQLEPNSTVVVSQSAVPYKEEVRAGVVLKSGENVVDLREQKWKPLASLDVTLVVPETWPQELWDSIRLQVSHSGIGPSKQLESGTWESLGSGLWKASFLDLTPGLHELMIEPGVLRESLSLQSGSNAFSFDLTPVCGVRVLAEQHSLLEALGPAQPKLVWWYADSPGQVRNVFLQDRWQFGFACVDKPLVFRLVTASGVTQVQDLTPAAGDFVTVDLSHDTLPVGKVYLSLVDGLGRSYGPSNRMKDFSLAGESGEIVFSGQTRSSQYLSVGGILALPDESQTTIVVSPPGRYEVHVLSLGMVFEADFTPEGTLITLRPDHR